MPGIAENNFYKIVMCNVPGVKVLMAFKRKENGNKIKLKKNNAGVFLFQLFSKFYNIFMNRIFPGNLNNVKSDVKA